MRGYAGYDPERLVAGRPPLADLIGKGLLVLTVDQGPDSEIYQSVVELDGPGVADCVRGYFRQSDQIDTALGSSRGAVGEGRGGPVPSPCRDSAELGPGDEPVSRVDRQEAWNTTMVLMSSVTGEELTDPGLTSRSLLYRLFHDVGVRVHAPKDVRLRMQLFRRKGAGSASRPACPERGEFVVGGEIEVVCKFCNRRQTFRPEEVMRPSTESLN